MAEQTLDDNARKFTLNPIDPQFLTEHQATTYTMIADWLETGDDDEKKIVYKQFNTGNIQILLISKVTVGDSRTTVKQKITAKQYEELLADSTLCIVKNRSEFAYIQNGISFDMKYDEFAGSKLCILEVDGASEQARHSFDPSGFPAPLVEVTGNTRYYGYRTATAL